MQLQPKTDSGSGGGGVGVGVGVGATVENYHFNCAFPNAT